MAQQFFRWRAGARNSLACMHGSIARADVDVTKPTCSVTIQIGVTITVKIGGILPLHVVCNAMQCMLSLLS